MSTIVAIFCFTASPPQKKHKSSRIRNSKDTTSLHIMKVVIETAVLRHYQGKLENIFYPKMFKGICTSIYMLDTRRKSWKEHSLSVSFISRFITWKFYRMPQKQESLVSKQLIIKLRGLLEYSYFSRNYFSLNTPCAGADYKFQNTYSVLKLIFSSKPHI